MTFPFALLIAVLVAVLGAVALVRADPRRIANLLRLLGPVLLGLAGIAFIFTGRAGLGGMMLSGALAWYGSTRLRRAQTRTPGQKSTVRSAALEMELDHDSGTLSGQVLAGRFEGRALDELDLEELRALYGELAADRESLRLLETYLDGRFPLWREGADSRSTDGERTPSRSGGMSKEEAYEVLGLEPGASASQIRQAHRRLMQRLHPDKGGSSALAARINEARDILLSNHHRPSP